MNRTPAPASLDIDSGKSPGEEAPLIRQIVTEFCPRFAGGGEILHVSRFREPSVASSVEVLQVGDIGLEPGSKMPDVVVRHGTENWLLLIEAVTSDLPIVDARRDRSAVAMAAGLLRFVYVAAFADRIAFRRRAEDIPWGTHVWVAAEPGHLVHFGGDALLGPND